MRRRSIRGLLAAASIAVASLFVGNVDAAVPATITHQGRLYGANNTPVVGTIDILFSIYDAPNATVPVWSELHQVTCDAGYYSAALGSIVPFPAGLFDNPTLYSGMTVGADPEMSPRAPIGSVPSALVAGDVVGDIHPTSLSITGVGLVVNSSGQWVGDPSGLQGPAGADGAPGPAGSPGVTGATGAVGPQGSPGADGSIGPQGPAGPMGPQGNVGPQGPAGPMGPQGPVGATGAQGPAGPTGAQGVAGATGATGAQGPAGATGAQGVAGVAGATGATGAQGPAGPTGAQGVAGATGAQGVAGVAGATGAQGVAGVAGATGAQGPAGPTGAQGVAGATGATGAAGAGITVDPAALTLGACTAAEGGTLRSNGNRLEECDGTLWHVVAPRPSAPAWWAMDNTSGTDVTEAYLPVANRARAVGVTWSTGSACHLGGCATLSGTIGSYILLPAEVLDGLGDFTLSYWVKGSGKAGTFMFSLNVTGNDNYFLINAPTELTWSHFVVRRSAQGIHIYRDKVLHDEFLYSFTTAVPGAPLINPVPLIQTANAGWLIGQDLDCPSGCLDPSQAFQGSIDEVKVLPYAITDADITADAL